MHQRAWLDSSKALDEDISSNQVQSIDEVLLEKENYLLGSLQALEHLERHKERASERMVLVWQGDEHVFATWPDVQVVSGQRIGSIMLGRYVELKVVA